MVYAVLLYNTSLCARLGMTRYEAFHKKVPDVSNFCTFGCKVYAHVRDDKRKKLDPKSLIGIFLGPEVNGPGYKVLVYRPDLKSANKYAVHIVRDIVTYENLTAVTGMQDNGHLHWGGAIPLPTPVQVEATPEPLEALTGVPHLPPPPMIAAPLNDEVVDHREATGPGFGLALPRGGEEDPDHREIIDPGLGARVRQREAVPRLEHTVSGAPHRATSTPEPLRRQPAGHVPASTSIEPRLESLLHDESEPRRSARLRVSFADHISSDTVNGGRINKSTPPTTDPISTNRIGERGTPDSGRTQFSGRDPTPG